MIKDFHGYAVSDAGTVANSKGKPVKTYLYKHVAANISQVVFQIYPKKTFILSRIVAELFVDNAEKLPSVINVDNDIENCHADNLKWVSRGEKIKWALDLKQTITKNEECEFVGSTEYGGAF